MDYIFPQGGADATVYLLMTDDGGGAVTGLAAADVTATYKRPLSTETSISLSDLGSETDAHSGGGWIETDMEGLYRLDLPDAAIARGENFATVEVQGPSTAAGFVQLFLDPVPSQPQGAVSDTGATASQFDTNLAGNYADGTFVDAFIMFVEGAAAGNVHAVEQITGYTDAAGTIQVDGFPSAPADGDPFIIINR